ncbi:thiamine pyrophosphate-binding protein [Lampropedia puyangensis]|uniref:Thiamine pyrophosphate-binding protein n=1 Tax=Lampropedia puyangensis TaxID=1330072 RepID=A0A4S8EYL6_9BURK|nr:thiamine pyrophosphate-binding protein [Lampropedia puyangensis]THT99014.1 thiamine pyrophosphate-binding protein [Lampropedia puyangensis]
MTHFTTSAHSQSAGRVLVDALALHGVDRVFCIPGESYLEVLDALYDEKGIEVVVTKHEGAAANMAEADGKLTGKPGICMVTRGPGATHASIGVHIAQQDSTPMILFIGQIAREHKGRDVFQEMDYQAVFGPFAKLVIEVDHADRMAELIARAFHTAVSGRPGPVVVALPEDMLEVTTHVAACKATAIEPTAVAAPTAEAVCQLLLQARKPLVIAGGSQWDAAASAQLQRFAQTWNVPVASSFRRQDALDNNHPNYVGHLSLGMSASVRNMVEEADLILVLGARLTDTATADYDMLQVPRPAQKLVHCHVDVHELGRVFQSDLAIAAPPLPLLQALLDAPVTSSSIAAASQHWSEWTAHGRAGFDVFTSRPAVALPVNGVDLREVMLHASQALPANTIMTNGAGNYAVWLHRYYRYRQAKTELAPICGAMGYGLPAAIAASLRHPQRTVVCAAGDGCFMMYPQELATAAEFGAKLIVLLVNNGMYGTIRMHQAKRYPGRVSATRLKGPDYCALARSFGAYAEQVTRTEDFPAALARAQQHGGIAVLELMTDPMQITPDMRLSTSDL